MASDFDRDASHKLVSNLLDTGLTLVRNVRGLDPSDEEHAKCLKSAKGCIARIEQEIWKFKDHPETLSYITANLERLNFEISAIGTESP
jgi:hypothetical protein